MKTKNLTLGVLSNPSSFYNHKCPPAYKKISNALGENGIAIETEDKSQIKDALLYLLLEKKVNILGLNGGDGTIHYAINTLIELKEQGVKFEFPYFLLLNGGTYNISSRAMGTKGNPERTIKKFLNKYKENDISKNSHRRIKILKIEPEGKLPIYGFVYGSDVVANALELCAKMGSGYFGLLRLLLSGSYSVLFKGKMLEKEKWRLSPQKPSIIIDGKEITGTCGAVSSTVSLLLIKGLVKGMEVEYDSKGFCTKVVQTTDKKMLVSMLLCFLRELPHRYIYTNKNTSELITWGRFTLDGEIYAHEGKVRVTLSPFYINAIEQ